MKLNCVIILLFLVLGCKSSADGIAISSSEKDAFEETTGEPVVIADKEKEYKITIIDPGFYSWLKSFARAEGYYSQSFLENRNAIYVLNWNQRVLLPGQYPSNLYEWPIDYDPQTDYGYEVNYKLYNYFIYFQRKYNQRLGPYIPRL
ncbi:MAG: DUF6146 family protein [Robiginitalea sp.]|uniref:DUF6146 family protein n=1 Tax=Robiginitalea sp. TaxID=1902411 RepID=UPI003C779526